MDRVFVIGFTVSRGLFEQTVDERLETRLFGLAVVARLAVRLVLTIFGLVVLQLDRVATARGRTSVTACSGRSAIGVAAGRVVDAVLWIKSNSLFLGTGCGGRLSVQDAPSIQRSRGG